MTSTKNPKNLRELQQRLMLLGCSYEKTRSGHYRVVLPDGRSLNICSTPSEPSSLLDTVTRLRRKGLDVRRGTWVPLAM